VSDVDNRASRFRVRIPALLKQIPQRVIENPPMRSRWAFSMHAHIDKNLLITGIDIGKRHTPSKDFLLNIFHLVHTASGRVKPYQGSHPKGVDITFYCSSGCSAIEKLGAHPSR
jgi:hypothetical protein